MKTKTNLLICMLCVLGFASCTDWSAKYLEEAKKAIATVENKYDYVKPVYDEFLNRSKTEDVCIVRNSADELSEMEAFSIALGLPESQKKTEKPDDVLILHFGQFGIDCNNEIFEPEYKNISFWDTEYVTMREYYLSTYYDYDSRKIDDRYSYEMKIEDLNRYFVEPLSKAKYLAVVEDLILAKPKYGQGGFVGGGVTAMVYMYNLDTFEKMDSFFVAAINSDKVQADDRNDLMIDLYRNLANNLYYKLKAEAWK